MKKSKKIIASQKYWCMDPPHCGSKVWKFNEASVSICLTLKWLFIPYISHKTTDKTDVKIFVFVGKNAKFTFTKQQHFVNKNLEMLMEIHFLFLCILIAWPQRNNSRSMSGLRQSIIINLFTIIRKIKLFFFSHFKFDNHILVVIDF